MEGSGTTQEMEPPRDVGAALCDHIRKQALYGRLFSDITVEFHGKQYLLHKLVLAQSDYFHCLLSGPWAENGKDLIQLQIDDPRVTIKGLESAFAFMYGVPPAFTTDNVCAILAVACFLGLETLCDHSTQFIIHDLCLTTFERYCDFTKKRYYGRLGQSLQNAFWSFLCTYGSDELRHYLPKLPLEVLCHLLKSDELWVYNEKERYRFAKWALIEWKLAQKELIQEQREDFEDNIWTKRNKTAGLRTTGGTGQASMSSRRSISRKKCSASKENCSGRQACDATQSSPRTATDLTSKGEQNLKRLRRLWENDAIHQFGGFDICSELFTDGGIIYANLRENEISHVERELEDANLPTDAANDSKWHRILLEHLSLEKGWPSASKEPANYCDNANVKDNNKDANEDLSKFDGSEWDRLSIDSSDDSDWDTENAENESEEVPNSSLVCFSSFDTKTAERSDPGRWKTTGGFTWSAKPNIDDMRLVEFPPVRFGRQFLLKKKIWKPYLRNKPRYMFYGGSTWYIDVCSSNDRIRCQLCANSEGMLQDTHEKVRYRAKIFAKTISGLRCVAGAGVHRTQLRGQKYVTMILATDEVSKNEPFRVCCVLQLIEEDKRK